jgi:hypothetical protein
MLTKFGTQVFIIKLLRLMHFLRETKFYYRITSWDSFQIKNKKASMLCLCINREYLILILGRYLVALLQYFSILIEILINMKEKFTQLVKFFKILEGSITQYFSWDYFYMEHLKANFTMLT